MGAVSYAAASAAFLALTLVFAAGWRGRSQGARPVIAAAMSAVWAAGLAWHGAGHQLPLAWISVLEFLRTGAWIHALVGVAAGALPRFLTLGSQVLWVVLLVAACLFAIPQVRTLVDGDPALLLAPGGLTLALTVLVLIEQIYRNSNADGRYGLKFLAIGLGGICTYDLFMYSQAQLLQGISADLWLARGFVVALLVPCIAVAARRTPQWSLDVFVSRQVVLFTTSIMAVGTYLLVMSAGGYLVRHLGGRWGVMANIIFFAGALIVLAAILASGAMRRQLRVFVSKHFYRNKYDYRVEWLRFVRTLSGGDEGDMRRTSLQAIAQVFESPGAVMYGRSDAASQFVPTAAWPMRLDSLQRLAPVSAGEQMLRFVAQHQWVVDLKEHASSPEIYQNVALPDGLRAEERIRVLLPLLQLEELVGFVLLFAPPPPFELTYEDRDLLKTLGRHVASIVMQLEADRRLAENRQFEAYHRLTAFMMHDLKNSVAQLQLVVRNAEKHRHNPEFVDDAIGTISNAVERMTRLIEQLRDSSRRPRLETIDLVSLARGVVSRCADRAPSATFGDVPATPVVVRADPDRLSASLEHVIRNAQDACSPQDSISVAIAADGGRIKLSVSDTGCGMAPEFVRERLFRPFDSTKGSKGMGIGAFQVREYARSLGGDAEVQSAPGSGTRFDIILVGSGGDGCLKKSNGS